ncbi:MAG: DUF5666 domain-containing protein [Gammaproteobacteria bacterium]|nr:DUF5666 domain-containing protein [Gammaproteobacteria bacterium]
MNSFRYFLLSLALLLPLLTSCGGSGGVAGTSPTPIGGGIGGTGATSSGSINGFGSIFVNGVEFDTDEAEVVVNDQIVTENELRLGMVVLVSGAVNDDAVSGSATRVVYTNLVQGPIDSIDERSDGEILRLGILGQQVIVERTATVFDQVRFDSLALGDVLEISGFVSDDQSLRATRAEKTSDFVAGVSEIELAGAVENLTGTQFTLGGFQVDFSGADLSDLPGGGVTAGLAVRVHGTLVGSLITSDRIAQASDIRRVLTTDEIVSIEGAISALSGANQFLVEGVSVDASGATFEPGDLNLRNGLIVQVDGTWDGNVLVAGKVQLRRGRVAIEAVAMEIDAAGQSLTLQLNNGTVTVQTNDHTLIGDSTGQLDRVDLSNFSTGDFLAVEAIDTCTTLLATFVNRRVAGGDLLQAPVESFTPGVSITMLGISFDTQGAQFQDAESDSPSTSSQFYTQLQVGDLVRVRDDQLTNGVADRVVFGL